MKTIHRFLLAAGFVVLSGIVSLLAAPSLPAELVTNWDAAGNPNGTMQKTLALWLTPALMAGILGLFAVIPRIDPLRENIAEFRSYYDWFVVIFTIYMFVVHAGVVAFNLGYEFDFTYLILVAAAGLFYYSGVVLTHAKQNWFVGIRTPWTLSSEGSLGTNPRARRPPLQTHRHPHGRRPTVRQLRALLPPRPCTSDSRRHHRVLVLPLRAT